MRQGSQSGEQEFLDWWRKAMGYDAPITNCDIVAYDQKKAIALAEIKIEDEKFDESNRMALLDLAERSWLPLYEFRWYRSMRRVHVTKLAARRTEPRRRECICGKWGWRRVKNEWFCFDCCIADARV
jgi:hypothetical protein